MTCIAGLVDDEGRIYMGADSAGTSGWDLRKRREPKVFRIHWASGDMVIGVTGYPRMAQLLHYKFTPPEHPMSLSVEAYLATHFVDALRTLFKDAGYAQKEKEREQTDSVMLVGYRGHLVVIESNYQLNEQDKPYEAVGCGDSFALGVFYATEHMTPKRRLQLALEAAEAFSAGVRGPFTFETLEPMPIEG